MSKKRQLSALAVHLIWCLYWQAQILKTGQNTWCNHYHFNQFFNRSRLFLYCAKERRKSYLLTTFLKRYWCHVAHQWAVLLSGWRSRYDNLRRKRYKLRRFWCGAEADSFSEATKTLGDTQFHWLFVKWLKNLARHLPPWKRFLLWRHSAPGNFLVAHFNSHGANNYILGFPRLSFLWLKIQIGYE